VEVDIPGIMRTDGRLEASIDHNGRDIHSGGDVDGAGDGTDVQVSDGDQSHELIQGQLPDEGNIAVGVDGPYGRKDRSDLEHCGPVQEPLDQFLPVSIWPILVGSPRAGASIDDDPGPRQTAQCPAKLFDQILVDDTGGLDIPDVDPDVVAKDPRKVAARGDALLIGQPDGIRGRFGRGTDGVDKRESVDEGGNLRVEDHSTAGIDLFQSPNPGSAHQDVAQLTSTNEMQLGPPTW
jgi:hypothetical protein